MPYARLNNGLGSQRPLRFILNYIHINSTDLDPSFGAASQSISDNKCMFSNTPFLIHHEGKGRAEKATVK